MASIRSTTWPGGRRSLPAISSSTTREPRRRRCATRTGRCTTTCRSPGRMAGFLPLIPFHFTLVQNIKRDPFEQAVATSVKSAFPTGGSLGAPATAFQYDWSLLPIGQQLWLKHLETFEKFPPLQPAESYNLSSIMEEVKKAAARAPSD